MIYLLVCIQVLLMGVNGHSISKLKINNETSDVYQIKEDKSTNTVTFTNPKTDQPTLREIVYYHLVERPYGQSGEPVKERPEFDDTERPFTNGHGFLEPPEEAYNTPGEGTSSPTESEENYETGRQNSESDNTDLDEEIEYYYEDEASELENPEDDEEHEEIDVRTPEDSEDISTASAEADEDQSSLDDEEKTKLTITTPAIESGLEHQAKHARKLLFDRVKERYYSKNNDDTVENSTPSERRKREINVDIPEAPRLGPINYESLPPYLRMLISTEKPQLESQNSESDERLREIKHRMRSMLAQIDEGSSEEAPAPKTYGMNLTEDHGYVWNDLWAKPGVHYSIEASESVEEDKKPHTNSEEEPANNDKESREVSKESTEVRDSSENNHSYDKSEEIREEEAKTEDKVDREDISTENDDEDIDTSDENGRKRHKDKDSAINDLLENDQFWKWLADWTTIYMEVFTEHINKKIKEEVASQIKPYIEAQKDDKQTSTKDEEKEKPEEKDSDKESSEKKDNNCESGKEEVASDENKKDIEDKPTADIEKTEEGKNEDEMLKRRKDKDENKKPNIDSELESNKNSTQTAEDKKDESKKQKEQSSNVHAENLYGNSIGSDSVTNIFIFYPNSDASKVIHDVKNSSDSHLNIFQSPVVDIDERINVPDEDKKGNDKTNQTSNEKEDGKDEKQDTTTQAPVDKEKDTATEKEIAEEIPTTIKPDVSSTEKTEIVTSTEKSKDSDVSIQEETKNESSEKEKKPDNDDSPKENDNDSKADDDSAKDQDDSKDKIKDELNEVS